MGCKDNFFAKLFPENFAKESNKFLSNRTPVNVTMASICETCLSGWQVVHAQSSYYFPI